MPSTVCTTVAVASNLMAGLGDIVFQAAHLLDFLGLSSGGVGARFRGFLGARRGGEILLPDGLDLRRRRRRHRLRAVGPAHVLRGTGNTVS